MKQDLLREFPYATMRIASVRCLTEWQVSCVPAYMRVCAIPLRALYRQSKSLTFRVSRSATVRCSVSCPRRPARSFCKNVTRSLRAVFASFKAAFSPFSAALSARRKALSRAKRETSSLLLFPSVEHIVPKRSAHDVRVFAQCKRECDGLGRKRVCPWDPSWRCDPSCWVSTWKVTPASRKQERQCGDPSAHLFISYTESSLDLVSDSSKLRPGVQDGRW